MPSKCENPWKGNVLRTKRTLLQMLAVPAFAAATLALAAAPAAASGKVHDGASPKNACSPGDGPYLKVLSNDGIVYHVVYGPITDDNGTSSKASDAFTNTWSGTVSTTVSATLEVSVSDVVASAKASVSGSVTKSATVTVGHTTTYNIDPHKELHVEYTVKQYKLLMDKYYVHADCSAYNEVTGYAYVDDGVGWHTWETAYSG
jgi:hypothetical protein